MKINRNNGQRTAFAIRRHIRRIAKGTCFAFIAVSILLAGCGGDPANKEDSGSVPKKPAVDTSSADDAEELVTDEETQISEDGEELPEQHETPQPLSDSDAYPNTDLKFGELADITFVFSSGVGAWFTEVKIKPDGTFTGNFSDANMGESGNGYPNGTIYHCSFSGKFSALEKTGDYEYSMKCESLTQEGNIGEETISDGVRYVISTPYGFDDADIFFLYLPGKSVDELPKEFLEWVAMPRAIDFTDVDVIDFWGLYNAAGKTGFSG